MHSARRRESTMRYEVYPKTTSNDGQALIYQIVIVCILVFFAHFPSLRARAGFQDDSMYIHRNVLVQNPGWESTKRFFLEIFKPSTVSGYYQPLTMTSLMCDVGFAGRADSFRIFHQTSLALHIANTALIAVLLYMLFGRSSIAAGVALLFGLHPLSIESVCWLSERKTVLATFFALLSLVSYVGYSRKGSKIQYSVCLLTYVMALLSKPTAISLPFAMMLLDYWPLKRLNRRTLLDKVPLCGIACVFGVLTFFSQAHAGGVQLPDRRGMLEIPALLCHNIIFYLRKIFWPIDMSPHYEFTSRPMILSGVIGAIVLLALVFLSLQRRRTKAFATSFLIFFVMMLPAMGIIRVTPVLAANRYAYLPLIGLLLFVACVLASLHNKLIRRSYILGYSIVVAILIPVVVVETIAMRRYQDSWQDTETLYRHMLSICPRSAILHSDLGVWFAQHNRHGEAMKHYRQAIQISPDFHLAHNNIAIAYSQMGDTEAAERHYRKAVELRPSYSQAWNSLGFIQQSRGQLKKAIYCFQRSVEANPRNVPAQHNLGKAWAEAGQMSKAFQQFEEVLRLNKAHIAARREVAWLRATHPDPNIRDGDEALRYAETASELARHRNAQVHDALGAAYAARGQFYFAIASLKKALTCVGDKEDDLRKEIMHRIELYRDEKLYLEDPRRLIPESAVDVQEEEREENTIASGETLS